MRIHDYIAGSSKTYSVGKRKTKEQTAREQREEAKREEAIARAAWVMAHMGEQIDKMRKREDNGR